MIITEIYNGQGLGNQLWCYVVTRCIAKHHGFDYGVKSPEKFKCNQFIHLDIGQLVKGGDSIEGGPPKTLPDEIDFYYKEKITRHPLTGEDISAFDQNLFNIKDRTKIDGNMQCEQYVINYKNEIKQWLKVDPAYESNKYASDDICILNFRGGEYKFIRNVFLPRQYWDDAISQMRTINKNFKFVVVTDDVKTAKRFFPHFEIVHSGIAGDYVAIKNAHYLIIANTSFAWFPTWLNDNLKLCIAPLYWWAYNYSDGYWACDGALTRGWLYLGRDGKFYDYDQCKKNLDDFHCKNRQLYNSSKINKNFLVVSSFDNDLSWIPKKTQNYLIYERGLNKIPYLGVDKTKVINSPNLGYNLYDYFSYIIENYNNLNQFTIFCKGNIFPRHVSEDYFDKIANNETFTPFIDVRLHNPKWPFANLLSDTSYIELNDSWYLDHHPVKYFHSYNEFLQYCFDDAVLPKYIQFAPGGNYLVPKECILKYPKIFYENLRTFISYTSLPGEAHIIERALQTIWTCNYKISERMSAPLRELLLNPVLPKRPRNKKDLLIEWIKFFLNYKSFLILLNKYSPTFGNRLLKRVLRIFGIY